MSAQGYYLTGMCPPYFLSGGSYYIPQDGMSLATIPSLGSWSAISTDTATVTTQTNGNQMVYGSGGYWFLQAPSVHTSIEAVFNIVPYNGTSPLFGGIWIYDSTNSKIYTWILDSTVSGAIELQKQTWTYSGSGVPSYSSDVPYVVSNLTCHLKIAVSGTTATFYLVGDGNTYIPVATQTVGTVSAIGVNGYYGYTNFLSVVAS